MYIYNIIYNNIYIYIYISVRWQRWQPSAPGKAGKAGRISGPKSGISLRNEAPPVELCGAVYRTKGGAGGSYFQRLKESEKGSRGDGAAETWLQTASPMETNGNLWLFLSESSLHCLAVKLLILLFLLTFSPSTRFDSKEERYYLCLKKRSRLSGEASWKWSASCVRGVVDVVRPKASFRYCSLVGKDFQKQNLKTRAIQNLV